ncbi:uncharacterized protein LOC119422081 [Nematolebias whitei]|uniref:uncharacterized protein LOC119422081 n=1 Tax=Nematolebias whitei TaxID=451745 RepID=UPI00189A8A88|nr:uncharacterized protein LOC119422081 [Nematolebias whitei]
MTEQDKMDKVIFSTTHSSRESLDNDDKNFTSTAYQDRTFMDGTACPVETCYDKPGKQYEDSRSEDEESNEETKEIILSDKKENLGENQRNRGSFPQPISSTFDENFETETYLETKSDKINYVDIDEKHFKVTRDQQNSERAVSNDYQPTLPGFSANKDELQSPETSKFCKFNQIMMEEATNQPQVVFSGEVTTGNGDYGGRSLDSNLTKCDCLKRESDISETQITQLPFCEDSEEMVEQVDGSRRIVTDIQQGKQLLHRLQMVQQRHDEIPNMLQEISKEVRVEEEFGFRTDVKEGKIRGESMASEEEEGVNELITVKREEAKTNQTEDKNVKLFPTKATGNSLKRRCRKKLVRKFKKNKFWSVRVRSQELTAEGKFAS